MNVFNNRLINISFNPNVHDSCKLVLEVKDDKVRTEVLDNIDNVKKISNDFNPEVTGSLKPNGHKEPELREWEKNILMHLNNVNLVERDDRKTSYVKFKLFKRYLYGLALVNTGNLVKGTLVSSEFWKMIRGKMREESNARVHMAEKGVKGLRVLGKGERIKFYLDDLDHRFEVEPIVIEGLNHAVNFGIEFFRQQKVSISCTEKEVKLVTGSEGQEKLTRLCSAHGKPFPFTIKGRRVDKKNKKCLQVLPAVWKAERRGPEVNNIGPVEEVLERKLWSDEKITIPAGSARLVKVRTEGNWKGAGVVESLPIDEQEKGTKVLLPENAYDLSESVQAV